MPNFTSEQQRAIDARGTNLLLSAAAGSGKTTVLVERVLDLIRRDGAQLDRLLVVTFTRAAAADMRAKLSEKLSARAGGPDGRVYLEQLNKLERASISTLHAFCADFLRTYFEAAQVDPSFRILDDVTAERLMDEALDEVLEEAYAAGGDALMTLDYGRGPRQVRELARSLCRAMEARPDAQAWLGRIGSREIVRAWMDEIERDARRAIKAAQTYLGAALGLDGLPASYAAAAERDMGMLQAMLGLDDYEALREAVISPMWNRWNNGKGSETAKDTAKVLHKKAKDELKAAKIKDIELKPALEDAEALVPEIELLGKLAADVAKRYDEKKAELSGLTYNDLEHKTLRALRDDDVALGVRARYDYIFIDEYQDTSDIQEAIVGRICRQDNVFMVGDVKQSIYRFRQAEPALFMEKYAAYGNGEGGTLLPLTRNFRSKRSVLDFVNMVFGRLMKGGDSEIMYDDLARLNPGLPDEDPGAPVEIHLLDMSGVDPAGQDAAPDAELEEMADAEREALFIAQRIREMMAEDPSLRYRDFAVLTRVAGGVASAMLPRLLEAGIPAYSDSAGGYFDTMEVRAALTLLRLVSSRRSDVDLIGALRLPMVGLRAEALAQIRIAHREGTFADAAWREAYGTDMGVMPGEGAPLPEGAQAEALRAFWAQLERWRTLSGAVSTGRLLRQMLEESGLYTYVGALPGGAQRQANLSRLTALAARFDAETSGSVVRFLRYAADLESRGDGEAAHLLGENDDVVRLMTVHKSKGLEFRVVFGAQLARRYRTPRADSIDVHRTLGVGMYYYDRRLRSRRKTIGQTAITLVKKREEFAEELRILYVMLTRAQERLILTGVVDKLETSRANWMALKYMPGAATSHLDAIMAARAAAENEGEETWSTVRVHAAGALRSAAEEQRDEASAFRRLRAEGHVEPDMRLLDEMRWHYPDDAAAGQPLKLTVSGLVRTLEGPKQLPEIMKRPAFMEEAPRDGLTAAERGTAFHRAMQLIDFSPLASLDAEGMSREIARQLADLAARKRMSQAQLEAVRPEKLAAFWAGGTGRRLMASERVEREWPFNMRVDAERVLTPEEAGGYAGTKIIVQGTIDCCFIEDGQWVLLDYKTDGTDDLEAIRRHYERQLKTYALALETITGISVKERVLCLIGQGKEIRV
ncbi:MAG: helicase-exonuclease AddAB subunit AddA [Clostridiales bacterium]|nr:helicase-exonuclease AddAB subunit AddA [Clostridiales bacterium]